MCRPTVACLHTHLSWHAHSSCIFRVTVHARSIGALAYFRHDALVCSGLSMYTHVHAQSHRGTYIYMSSDSQNSISMLSSQVHTCAQTFTILHTQRLPAAHRGFRICRYMDACSEQLHTQCAQTRPGTGAHMHKHAGIRAHRSVRFSSSQVHTCAQTLKGMLSGAYMCTHSHRACLCAHKCTCTVTTR